MFSPADQHLLGLRLHEFDTVPEWIVDIGPPIALQRLIVTYGHIGLPKSLDQFDKPGDKQRRMRFLRRPEVMIDSKMDLDGRRLKPATTSNGKMWGLRHLGNAKQALVEPHCDRLTTNGHSELDVIERLDDHPDRLDRRRNLTPSQGTRVIRHLSIAEKSRPLGIVGRCGLLQSLTLKGYPLVEVVAQG